MYPTSKTQKNTSQIHQPLKNILFEIKKANKRRLSALYNNTIFFLFLLTE